MNQTPSKNATRPAAFSAAAATAPSAAVQASPAGALIGQLILKNRPIRLRGRSFIARIVSAKLQKTATVEREYRHYLPKYERYTMRKKKLYVHNPPELNAREGDTVRITECRPISKTKRFVIVEKVAEHESNKEQSQ